MEGDYNLMGFSGGKSQVLIKNELNLLKPKQQDRFSLSRLAAGLFSVPAKLKIKSESSNMATKLMIITILKGLNNFKKKHVLSNV